MAGRGFPARSRSRVRAEDAFTLTELLVVAIIVGVLAALAFTAFIVQRNKAFKASAVSSVRNTLTAATSVYKTDGAEGYPPDLDVYRDELSGYTYVPGDEPVTEQNSVSLEIPAEQVFVAAARGEPYCYYARQENGGSEVFYERRSIGSGVNCRGNEFTNGAGTGW